MLNFACRYCQPRLNAYIAGELPLKARRRIARHLNECSVCYREYLNQREVSENLSRFVPMTGQLQAPQLQRMWASIEGELGPSSGRSRRYVRARYGVALLMMIVGLLLPLTLGNRNVPFSVPSQPAPPTEVTRAPRVSHAGVPVTVALVITLDRDHTQRIALQNTPEAQAY